MPYGFNNDKSKYNLNNLFYKGGDNIVIPWSNVAGHITSNCGVIRFSVQTPKPFIGNNIKIKQLSLIIRHERLGNSTHGGYIKYKKNDGTFIPTGRAFDPVDIIKNGSLQTSGGIFTSVDLVPRVDNGIGGELLVVVKMDANKATPKYRAYDSNVAADGRFIPNNIPLAIQVKATFYVDDDDAALSILEGTFTDDPFDTEDEGAIGTLDDPSNDYDGEAYVDTSDPNTTFTYTPSNYTETEG